MEIRVLVYGKSRLLWIEFYGLKSSHIWERALLQIPYYVDCLIVPTTSNLILFRVKNNDLKHEHMAYWEIGKVEKEELCVKLQFLEIEAR